MRKIILSVLVIVIVVAGGYTALWFKKSSDFKQAMEQTIASLNARYQDPAHKDVQFMHYDALQAGGFPFALTYTFQKPVFNYSAAIVTEAQRLIDMPVATTPDFDWKAQFASAGTISVTSNILLNNFTIAAEGDTHSTTLINNTVRHDIVGATDGPTLCNLTIAHNGNVPRIEDVATFLNMFRHMHCSVNGMRLTDATSNTPLASTEAFSFDINNAPTHDGNYSIGIKLDEKNAQSTAAYDVILNDYMSILYAQIPTLKKKNAVKINFAEYGMRNMTVDMAYEGPIDMNQILTPAANWHFDINKLDSTNALYTGTNRMHVNVANRTIDFLLHTDGTATPSYDTVLGQQISDLLKKLSQETHASPAAAGQVDTALLFKDEAFIQAVVPSVSKLGNTSAVIDFKLQLPDAKAQQALKVNAFELNATPYGIAIKGELERGVILPTGDVTLTCRSCDALVGDLGHYLAGIEKVAAQYKPTKTPLVITDPLIDGVRQFLHAVAEKSDTPDVSIHLVMKNTGEISVSGKQPNQVLVLFSTLVAPYLKPAASQAPATAPSLAAPH